MGVQQEALVPVRKPERIATIRPVDTAPFLDVLKTLSEPVWLKEDGAKDNNFSCFHHTQHIVLRFIAPDHDPRHILVKPAGLMLGPVIEPLMRAAVSGLGFETPVFPKAMFARLAPRSYIDEHIDGQSSNPLVHKLHIPLVTNPDVFMTIGGERFHLATGHLYEVNNIIPHAVENGGDTARIHFIFEVFEGAGHTIKEVSPQFSLAS